MIGKFHELAIPILHHCEQWDGSGYPQKLRGSDIPIESGILGIVVAFDEAYKRNRETVPENAALDETIGQIMEQSGTVLDPMLMWIFRDNEIKREIEQIYNEPGERTCHVSLCVCKESKDI
ncbi:HD-GYP domain-containing protein [Thiolapillus sp.]|uniref:HD-GYP domain-containing protein n=1 Tax=Thiolapillus sp. TaxID=2017437 RepID=UPI003AF508F2